MKRFWTNTQTLRNGATFSVELDGRPVKLPSGAPLTVPFQSLADAIAKEWADAPQDFSPENLPFTRLASTAQERVALHRDDIIGQLAAYGMNDLLCYRADGPAPLVARQNKVWDEWLLWAKAVYGLDLQCTAGLIPINQPPKAAATLRGILSAQNDYTIAALGVVIPALGSFVLSLALAAKALSAEAACKAAFLDELWQEDHWGADDEAVKRRAKIIQDVSFSARFMEFCGT